jgi:hypothetical protein
VESDSFIVGPVEMIGRRGNGAHFVAFHGKSENLMNQAKRWTAKQKRSSCYSESCSCR